MIRQAFATLVSLVFAISAIAAENSAVSTTSLSASEIVSKNVSARGGLEAWTAVQTMAMSGKMGAGGNRRPSTPAPQPHGKAPAPAARSIEELQLPFLMELKRPGKMRMELEFNGQTAIQVYDGQSGWKLRPFLGRTDVEPYTSEEQKSAAYQLELDGPLVNYAAKGNQVELVGTEKVEGRNCYKLKVTMKNGNVIHVWVDNETFLEAKIEGQPRRLDGAYHPVEIYYRDYRAVDGLKIPFLLETRVLPVTKTPSTMATYQIPAERIAVEKVTINPKLDDALFSKQALETTAKGKPVPKK